MAIIRPPVTGDVQLDSWMNQVNLALQTSGGAPTQVALASGTSGSSGSSSGSVNAVTLVLYKGSNNNPLQAAEKIQSVSEYTYATGEFVDAASNPGVDGWSRDLPTTTDRYIWAVQVNIADTTPSESIPANAWSNPIVAYDRGQSNLEADVIAVQGNVFNNDVGATDLRLDLRVGGSLIPPANYTTYVYDWKADGKTICVNASTREAEFANGTIITVDVNGTCPIGVPAENIVNPINFPNDELRQITISAKAVDNTLPITVDVQDK